MPVHDIDLQVPAQTIKNSDATIAVWADGAVLGRLEVSRGTIDWLPGKARTRYSMRWETLDELMRANATRHAS